jgi:hypothetical protein
MYLRRFVIEDVRSIRRFELEFEKGAEPGWHVILGTNGAGKSSVIRSIALLLMGEREAYASRQDFGRWIRSSQAEARISGTLSSDPVFDAVSGSGRHPMKAIAPEVTIRAGGDPHARSVELKFGGDYGKRTVWGDGEGWFSASFGPFRRFTGGDRIYDRLFVSNPRLAPHLTALGEDVALTEALDWLCAEHVRALQDESTSGTSKAREIVKAVKQFINSSEFLPHGALIEEITDKAVLIRDGNSNLVPLDQLSDGYRSALSMTLEIIRQMFKLYGFDRMMNAIDLEAGSVDAPGIVAIDEVDAHLHPTWQRDIGRWLTRCFPRIQFIVTTHSPIVCRPVANDEGEFKGTVWRLPSPGSDDRAARIDGAELDLLVFGNVLDAYSTELFGRHVTRSPAGDSRLKRLTELNALGLARLLTPDESSERRRLRANFPADAGRLPDAR